MRSRDLAPSSVHGAVLVHVAANPASGTDEILRAAEAPRHVGLKALKDLTDAGLIRLTYEGHREHYTVKLDASLNAWFLHPRLHGRTLRQVLRPRDPQ